MQISRKNIVSFATVLVAVLIACFLVFFVKPFILSKAEKSRLPEGWAYQKSSSCQIDVPLPPKEHPYLGSNGEYWNFEEKNNNQNGLFNNTAVAIFKNPQSDQKGVMGAVVVSCTKNNSNDSARSLVEKYQAYLDFQNQNTTGQKVTLTTLRHVTIWGKDVFVISFEGGGFNPKEEFYVVATSKIVYLISKLEDQNNATVKEAVENIFNNLSFR